MKRNLLLIMFAVLVSGVFAQTPQRINYQAVARDATGELIVNQHLDVRIVLMQDETLAWQEVHQVTTNEYGLFTIKIGEGDPINIPGAVGSFSEIDWGIGNYSIEVAIDDGNGFKVVGIEPLASVPYALFAASGNEGSQELDLDGTTLSITNGNAVDLGVLQDGNEDDDADPENELQSLSYTSGSLSITNDPDATSINIDNVVSNVSGWDLNADTIETLRPVAIGTNYTQAEEPLFEVRNNLGNPVFAVYNDGVMVFVDEDKKGVKGGFAVGGYSSGSKGVTNEYMRITPDSVRFWVPEDAVKGRKGGFAVGGYNSTSKAPSQDLMYIHPDSIRFWVPESTPAKGVKGGFAVGGYNTATKGTSAFNFLEVNRSETNINFDTTNQAKGRKGGFAVGGYNSGSKAAGSSQLMSLTRENYLIGENAGANLTTGRNNSLLGYESGFNMTNGRNNVFLGTRSGYHAINPYENAFIGNASGYNTVSGYGNVFVGNQSGFLNESGYFNSFVGYQAGYAATSFYNTFFGFQAGYNNTTGKNNIAIGYQAGYGSPDDDSGVTGGSNSFIGYKSGFSNTSGENNIFLGTLSGYSNLDGNRNVFLGNATGKSNTSGNDNVFIGNTAGESNTVGFSNIFLGEGAGNKNIGGDENVFIGQHSGGTNTGGDSNVFLGTKSGNNNTTGSNNVFLGTDAGFNNQTGSVNVFIGTQAGNSNTTGYSNVFLGEDAGLNNQKGFRNVFIGYQSGYNNIGEGTTWDGTYNTFIGYRAGYSNTSGGGSVIIGYSAGASVSNENYLTALGYRAGAGATGPYNVFIGGETGKQAGDGSDNTFVGFQSGVIADGSFNTAYGRSSGWNHDGDYNVAVGYNAGHGGTTVTFNNNVHVGSYTGQSQTTGSNNTFIGHQAGRNSTTGEGNVFIGYQSGYSEAGSNQLYISNSNTLNPLIYGDFSDNYVSINNKIAIGSTKFVPSADIDIDNTAATINLGGLEIANLGSSNMGIDGDIVPFAGSTSSFDLGNNTAEQHWDDVVANEFVNFSDIRTKKNVENLPVGLNEISQLRPVQFQYKTEFDNDNRLKYGLIAQEVELVLPHLVKGGTRDSDEQNITESISEEGFMVLNYINLVPVLVKAIQEQQAEIEALKAEKARYAELEEKINVLEEKLKILDNMAEK